MSTKLTEDQRSSIRKEYATGSVSQKVLAQRYFVCESTVFNVLNPDKKLKKDRKYRGENRERLNAYGRGWKRSHRENNPESNREACARYLASHREENRCRSRQWYELNWGAARASNKLWVQTNRETRRLISSNYRARSRGASGEGYSNEQWNAICKQIWGDKCAYCGVCEELTVEHILPLDRGGNHEPWNLVPACRPCNSSKNNRTLIEWRAGSCLWVETFALEVARNVDDILSSHV